MHIPDGYLSPSTCATCFGAAAPFWWVAHQKLRDKLHTKIVPQVSLMAAFSFVVMMFNFPIPGGTSSHAVGIAAAAIVLGPWAAVLAISVALGIQALFFGDGGMLTLGANCFNMAIAGTFVAVGVYKVVSGKTPLQSPRRVVAAGLAGYAAINVAALLTAVQFGVQPIWFTSESGVPLYSPFPLGVAMVAMMVPHLTLAGLAEAALAMGLVAWLQKHDVALLQATAAAPTAQVPAEVRPGSTGQPHKNTRYRPLWIGLALLMVISPLGLLATGTAWGEWAPEDIAIEGPAYGASSDVPAGLEKLASLWTAPFPDYSVPLLAHEQTAYIASAFIGVGLIWLSCLILGRTFASGSSGSARSRG